MDDHTWCPIHQDHRLFTGQTTSGGEVLNVYADEWTPNCQYFLPTGLFVRDGHRPKESKWTTN